MKKILFLLLLAPTIAIANPVDQPTAMLVAENFWWQTFKEHATFKDYSAVLNLTEIYLFEESNDNGFIIVSADDRAVPVLGYSRKGFVTENICPSMMSWLRSYETDIAHARNNNLMPDKTTQDEWNSLLAGKPLAVQPKAPTLVTPLLRSAWNQDAPYNLYCPGEGSEKAPTGCVATALAQVMYYWRYPDHGYGQNAYNYADFTDTNFNWQYGTLSADFEHTHYDWPNMVDTLRNSSDSVSIEAVALLNYHCGVALNMLYHPDGSMAFVTMTDNLLFDTNYYPTRIAAENVIPRFFGYSTETVGKQRINYERLLDWVDVIDSDLQKGRPVIFAGAASEGPSAGHCFVLDGINPYYYFHINMGWGGSYDGDYRLDAITFRGADFTKRQQAIIGMRPPEMFSVKVTCTGTKGDGCGIFHGEEEVCGKYVNMVTGDAASQLDIVAGDGYSIKTILLGEDTLVENGVILDETLLSYPTENELSQLSCRLDGFSTDTEINVVFSNMAMSIAEAAQQGSRLQVVSHDRNIVISGEAIGCGSVYDIMGRKVSDFDAMGAPTVSVAVAQRGIYIVRCGGKSAKVAVN